MKFDGKLFFLLLVMITCVSYAQDNNSEEKFLLKENFKKFPVRMVSSFVKAYAEYHFVQEAASKFGWSVSAQNEAVGSQRAWWIYKENKKKILVQTYNNPENFTHPTIITGDSLWTDYTLTVSMQPESTEKQSGILFRYQNDRCYYFFGINNDKAILKMVKNATAFHKPYEKILDEKSYSYQTGTYITLNVNVKGDKITASIMDGPTLNAEDSNFPSGKIGLMSDIPTKYESVLVTTTEEAYSKYIEKRKLRKKEERRLQNSNPEMVLWKKIETPGFGVGRNLRFGDLNNDGQIDVLMGQIMSYGPRGDNNELSCLTAMTFDGKRLWQIGKPDLFKFFQTTDVPFQIHDIDNNGKTEVVYCMNRKLIVVDGATGEKINEIDTPHDIIDGKEGQNILGDCLFFCDISGNGFDGDILIKNRYNHFWIYNNKLELIWEAQTNTGHYPYAFDIDNDGKDELAIDYSLYDNDGKKLWSLEGIEQHADGVAIVDFNPNKQKGLQMMYAASDEGYFRTDLNGNISQHHYVGHVQNPSVANFREDLPGLETVSVNFHGNQGIITFYDSEGNIYNQIEPVQQGSMMLPLNWTGNGVEYFVLSPDVDEGGVYDGKGRRVMTFPGDGHPYLCNAVLDIYGDARDEIVVWDPYEIWVYTQNDNPKKGGLYKPVRNDLYNYSNYQATVSLPGWTEK